MEYIPGLISIIIPVYNLEKYLDRCIQSVVAQSYSNIEILLIDDGSDDSSRMICDAWGRIDSRIKVYHKKNGGTSSARNLGLRKAEGEFIGFIDGDDYIKEDMYESMYDAMGEAVDIVTCGTVKMEMDRKASCPNGYGKSPKRMTFSGNEAIEELLLQRYMSFSPCDKLYRHRLFEKIEFPVRRTCEDLPVIYNLFKKSQNVINIGKVKYYYCYRADSASRRAFYPRRVDFVLYAGEICRDVWENYPQFTMQAEAMYIQYAAHIIRSIRASKERKKYWYIEKRIMRVFYHMWIRIILNPYILPEKKREYISNIILSHR